MAANRLFAITYLGTMVMCSIEPLEKVQEKQSCMQRQEGQLHSRPFSEIALT